MNQRLLRLVPLFVTAVGALLVMGVWAAGLAAVPLTVRADILYHREPIGEINVQQTVGQTIVAPYDGLYRVDVALADYRRQNVGPVIFRLWSAPPGSPAAQVVAEAQFRAETVVGDVTQAIEFPAVKESAGQQYYLELSTPWILPGGGIAPYFQPSAPYPDGTAYLSGRPMEGDLEFVLHFRVDGRERVRLLIEQMLPGKPRPLRWPWVPILLGAGYTVLAAAVVWGLRRWN
jgi:hypothetical protein